jgi:mannan endo-1,4-beta-mannosidase
MKHGGTTARSRVGPGARAALALIAAAAIAAGVLWYNRSSDPAGPLPVHLPTAPQSYLGIFSDEFPASYSPLTTFARETGAQPDLAMYYSGWFVPFPARFATTAASNGVVPLVQMDPDGISIAEIAAGKYDGYLSEYAEAVRAYQHPVILSFGHEMNGSWYSWGFRNVPAKTFVAAWRHVVTLFRVLGAKNVTWMWTVNIINDTQAGTIPSPAPWWPGGSYVNWVGIDGYYLKASWQFAPLFGPTIGVVREITPDPILIAETGAITTADQPAKIANLFAGIRDYGLLGFVWFDAENYRHQDFSISDSAALAAFGKGARTFTRPQG